MSWQKSRDGVFELKADKTSYAPGQVAHIVVQSPYTNARALVVIEAISRWVPGVVGNPASPREDSFADGLLEFPVYTRPREFRGRAVPDVLLSGDHAAIARWRRIQMLRLTRERRPELLARIELSEEDRRILRELEHEQDPQHRD